MGSIFTYERIKKVGRYYYRVRVTEECLGTATEDEYLAAKRGR